MIGIAEQRIQKISASNGEVFKPPEMKEVFFVPDGETEPEIARYAIFRRTMCVFSGIKELYGGTSGWPEFYIRLISEKENLDPERLIFYVLETYASGMQREKGIFSFARLEFKCESDGSLYVCGPIPEYCPPEIKEFFQDCIGVTKDKLH